MTKTVQQQSCIGTMRLLQSLTDARFMGLMPTLILGSKKTTLSKHWPLYTLLEIWLVSFLFCVLFFLCFPCFDATHVALPWVWTCYTNKTDSTKIWCLWTFIIVSQRYHHQNITWANIHWENVGPAFSHRLVETPQQNSSCCMLFLSLLCVQYFNP